MLGQLILRFIIGGVVVSLFSVAGDLFKPKSFAGIFGAAPSVALATLALTYLDKGAGEVSAQGAPMMAGGAALLLYCLLTAWLMRREHIPAWQAAGVSWVEWLAVALSLWAIFWSQA